MSWFRSLRAYSPMRRRSAKLLESANEWLSVYRLVDHRSDGQCEYWDRAYVRPGSVGLEAFVPAVRCPRQARQHHHVTKPRRAHHDVDHVIHLCIPHHERCEWPYKRGRLVVVPQGGGVFRFQILYAPDKFALRDEDANT